MTTHPDGLPIADAARLLGVSDKTIRRRIKAGQLRAHKLYTDQGYEWRVDIDQAPIVALDHAPDHRDSGLDNERLRGEVALLAGRVASLELLLSRRVGPPMPVALPREEVPCAPSVRPVEAASMPDDQGDSGLDNDAPTGFVARLRAWFGGGV